MTADPLDPLDASTPFLWDMREAALGAIRLTRGRTQSEFEADLELVSLVERAVQILGRSAQLVDQSLRDVHAEIPWRRLIGAARVLDDADDADDALEPAELWALLREFPVLVRAIAPLIQEDEPDW